MTRTTMQLWQPPGETVEAIAAVLGSHWMAAKAQPGLFWPGPANWLREQAQRLADGGRVFGERYLSSLAKGSGR